MKKTISICIPVYNESSNISIAIQEVESLFDQQLSQYHLEIIVTDNASTDNTWQVVQELAASRPYLRAFRFSRNFGYQNSVFAGLSLAAGDAVIEMDADLEDPPAIIPEFVAKWEEGHDIVYGVRSRRYGSKLFLFAVQRFYRILNAMSDIHIPENAGDFRLLDRKVVDILRELPERNLYLRGLVSFIGFDQCPVLYDRNERLNGKSKFKVMHYFALALDALTSFSKKPLRLIGSLGVLLFIFSGALALFYFIGYLIGGNEVRGFTTLVILTLFLHSATFIFLGVLGEYLSRIFDDSKFRPRVIIREAIHTDNPPPFI
ncbi:MAG: glycosyltransferase family 2 protein [Deltaproteobacteria bacterium]|nr:glycosyltransferase family 2 protein [Deltaproteobacteria bacterium]